MESFPKSPDGIIGALAGLSRQHGDDEAVRVLSRSDPSMEVFDRGEAGCGRMSVRLVLALRSADYVRVQKARPSVEGRICERASAIYLSPDLAIDDVRISLTTAVPGDWRRQLAAVGRPTITNQGRVRSDNVAPIEHEGLRFRSQAEVLLFNAFRARRVTFMPLPVALNDGKRIEPDFIILVNGMVIVVEVDGEGFHKESPLSAHERLAMFSGEGARVERVSARLCSTPAGAQTFADELLARLRRIVPRAA